MTMTNLKMMKMERLEAKIRRRNVEARRLLILEMMRQLQSKHRKRRKRVDVVALKMKRLKTPTEVTTTVVPKRGKEVVVIEVANVIAMKVEEKAATLARIRSAEVETRKKEGMVIGRRNEVVGMRMTAGTVMLRSVVANAMMLRMINPPRNLEGRIEIGEIVVTATVATVIVVTVIVVIVIGIMVGIEVRVKRRGDEKKLNKQKSQICKCVAFTCYRLK